MLLGADGITQNEFLSRLWPFKHELLEWAAVNFFTPLFVYFLFPILLLILNIIFYLIVNVDFIIIYLYISIKNV